MKTQLALPTGIKKLTNIAVVRLKKHGVRFEIAAGSTVFMPAGAVVSYQNGDAPMRALQVFAGPAPAAKYDAWTWDG